jgi:hypothetical protein
MAKKPETCFKEKCFADLQDIRRAGGRLWWQKIQQVSIRGTPDVLLCVNGTFWAMELKKSNKDKADPLQQYTLGEIKRAKGLSTTESPQTWKKTLETVKILAFGEPDAQ